LHRELIKFNLRKADKILSTSHVMAKETSKYTSKAIEVTPFGIDLNRFRPMPVKSRFDENAIVIGTVKWLDQLYGIEFLLKAFKILETKYQHLPLRLLIVGSGPLEKSLKELAKTLSIESKTVFTGRVNVDEIPQYHNMLTVFVSLSVGNSDSFGVVNIEASACEKPAVVADVGGLPEVVEDGVTGFVVPPKNPEKAAAAIEKLILDKDLRMKMGRAGRERVAKLYNWEENVEQMIDIYESLLRK
jgi:glycosyltransferase involved in cell wall biosynthesis